MASLCCLLGALPCAKRFRRRERGGREAARRAVPARVPLQRLRGVDLGRGGDRGAPEPALPDRRQVGEARSADQLAPQPRQEPELPQLAGGDELDQAAVQGIRRRRRRSDRPGARDLSRLRASPAPRRRQHPRRRLGDEEDRRPRRADGLHGPGGGLRAGQAQRRPGQDPARLARGPRRQDHEQPGADQPRPLRRDGPRDHRRPGPLPCRGEQMEEHRAAAVRAHPAQAADRARGILARALGRTTRCRRPTSCSAF